jgi:hypothetical protein
MVYSTVMKNNLFHWLLNEKTSWRGCWATEVLLETYY